MKKVKKKRKKKRRRSRRIKWRRRSGGPLLNVFFWGRTNHRKPLPQDWCSPTLTWQATFIQVALCRIQSSQTLSGLDEHGSVYLHRHFPWTFSVLMYFLMHGNSSSPTSWAITLLHRLSPPFLERFVMLRFDYHHIQLLVQHSTFLFPFFPFLTVFSSFILCFIQFSYSLPSYFFLTFKCIYVRYYINTFSTCYNKFWGSPGASNLAEEISNSLQ